MFHDDSLPEGWAFGREPTTNKKYYYNMITNERQEERPMGETSDGEPRPAKRPRPLDSVPPGQALPVAATTPTSTSITSPMDAVLKPVEALSTRKPSQFPPVPPDQCPIRASKEYFTKRFPDTRPMVRRVSDPSLFREEHAYLLEQLVRVNMERIFDVGAGLGGSTQFFLDATPAAKVFAIDLWHQEYCVDVLESASHVLPSTVELYRGLPGLFETFCANVWDRKSRIAPYRLPAVDAVKTLVHMSILPQLIYIDADLSYDRVKAFLDFMFTDPELVPRLPPRSGDIIVAGGGWDVSDGVKRAVQEAVAAYGLELHVERGTCWTFSRRLVHRSLNSSASLAKVSDTSRTKELQVEVKETPTSWATKINAILAAGDDVDALRRIMGKHGREKLEDGTWVPASEDCWIDTAQVNDRRRRSVLVASVKHSRMKCATMLIDEYGADVNYQTPSSSMYTGLIQAVYDDNVEMVHMLMVRGADPSLSNKWGESSFDLVKKSMRPVQAAAIAPLLRREESESAVPEDAAASADTGVDDAPE